MRIEAGELIARDHVDDGADEPAIEPAGAAEDQHHQHVGRALEAEHVERNGFGRLRQQRAGDAGDHRGDRVDRADMRPARRADRRHAGRVFADAAQRQPERRMDQPPRDQENRRTARQRVAVGGVAVKIELEVAEQRPHVDALQAIGAAGEPACAVGDFLQQQARSPSVIMISARCRKRAMMKLVR